MKIVSTGPRCSTLVALEGHRLGLLERQIDVHYEDQTENGDEGRDQHAGGPDQQTLRGPRHLKGRARMRGARAAAKIMFSRI